jgi:integrase/recombinase XerD
MPNIAFILFKPKTLKDGSHPVLLRLTQNRVRNYISTGFSGSEDEWNDDFGRFDLARINDKKRKKELKDANDDLDIKFQKAKKVLSDMERFDIPYTFAEFKQRYKVNLESKRESVYTYFNKTIDKLEKERSLSNAAVYLNTLNKIKKFHPKDLRFTEIDKAFLEKFKTKLLSEGLKPNTASIYLRTLRSLLNRAESDNIIPAILNPFKTGSFNLKKLSNQSVKRVITKDEFYSIVKLKIQPEDDLYDSWMIFQFSYFARGMNFKDVALLTWQNVTEGAYIRQKTKRAIKLSDNKFTRAILDHYRGRDDKYVFPVITKRQKTLKQLETKIQSARKNYNKDLKDIARMAEISINLTGYVARHTYATVLKKAGTDLYTIQMGLGHSRPSTTQIYLDSLDDSALVEAETNL